MKEQTNEKGITLIALVITIIVLLILARNKQDIEKCSNTSTLPIYCISFVISLLFTKQVLLGLMRFFFHFLVHKFYPL